MESELPFPRLFQCLGSGANGEAPARGIWHSGCPRRERWESSVERLPLSGRAEVAVLVTDRRGAAPGILGLPAINP